MKRLTGGRQPPSVADMKNSTLLAALGAAVLLPLTVGVPAHADDTFTGTVTSADPTGVILEPDPVTDACVIFPDPGSAETYYDDVNFVSQSNGPRRFAVQITPGGDNEVAIYVMRNGTCVAADYLPDSAAEAGAGIVDVEGVNMAVGDQVRVQIAYLGDPEAVSMPWTLTVQQPGTASVVIPATGNAGKYVGLSAQIDCATHSSSVTFTKKFAKKVDDVKWVKIKANGATLKKLKGTKLAKVAKKAKKGQPYVVTGIPAATTQLMVQIKLESGKKKTLSRTYSAC